MSIAMAIRHLSMSTKARAAIGPALDAVGECVERGDWLMAEKARTDAVAAFEMMLDAAIAAQREAGSVGR